MASKTFSLKLIACDKVFYEGEAEILTIPAADGMMSILANHESMVIAVQNGAVSFRTDKGEVVEAFTGTGFVYVMNNNVIMLSHNIERPEDIDLIRANEAKERAMEQMLQHQSKIEYNHSKASLARAMARMAYKNKYIINNK